MSARAPVELNLSQLPYAQQVQTIDGAIAAGHGAALLAELAGFRDHQPLAHAVAALARRGELEGALAHQVAERVLALPDPGLARVLRELEEQGAAPRALVDAIDSRLGALPLARIAGIGLVDRWLKSAARSVRDHAVREATDAARDAARRGRPEALTDAALIRISGSAYAELQALADAAAAGQAWRARIDRFAAAVLEALEAQPKSLSQANAEELLAKQVYTDPGHFLIELLQNADDAGARSWSVEVLPDRVVIAHDGAPFDARDVAGVLSIGQTTKGREQIGFFGVGFKSVYEICERPQIYSGPFSFEIADISIPRPLAPDPGAAADRTLLILPLRDPSDPRRSPDALYERVAELPAEVLMTLNHLEHLEARCGPRRRRARIEPAGAGRTRLVEDGRERTYLCAQKRAHFSAKRDARRAESTPILVAIALDDVGRPRPPPRGPTVYSYLPTGERSGLRFLVHAHFDVPVDRERLDRASPWNRWALGEAGPVLAEAFRRLVRDSADDPRGAERLDAALAIVPLFDELGDDLYLGLLDGLLDGLRDVPLLRGAAGERLAPAAALTVSDARFSRALAGVAIAGGRRPLAPLAPRDAEVARLLGARELDERDVVAALVRHGAAAREGKRFAAPWGPAGLVEIGEALAERGERAVDLRELAALPCLPDHRGDARRPHSLARATGRLRQLLSPLGPLVADELDTPRAQRFLDRLGVPVARVRDLVAALADRECAARVIEKTGVEPLFAELAAAPAAELEALPAAEIVATSRGDLAAVGEVRMTGEGPLAAFLRETEAVAPLVDAKLEAGHRDRLRTLGVATIDLAEVVRRIAGGERPMEVGALVRFHRALDALAEELTPSLARALARAPIFPARPRGAGARAAPERRPLVGEGAAWIPEDDDIAALWPGAPWLVDDVAALGYIPQLGVDAVGPDAVAEKLALDDGRADPAAPAMRRAAFGYLAARAARLPKEHVRLLAEAEVWPDVEGTLHPLAQLRHDTERASLAALYARFPRSAIVERGDGPESARGLARALGVEDAIAEPSFELAIRDLLELSTGADAGAIVSGELDDVIAGVLCDAAGELSRAALLRACDAALFSGTDGARRPLGAWSDPSPRRCHRGPPDADAPLARAFALGRYPLLAPHQEADLAPFLDAIDAAPPTVAELARALGAGEAREVAVDPATADAIRAAFVADRGALEALSGPQLREVAGLAIWPTTRGDHVAARAALRPDEIARLLPAHAGDWLAHLSATGGASVLDPRAGRDASALAALTFADPLGALLDAARALATPDAPISEQAPLLGSTARVAELAAAAAGGGAALADLPLSVTSGGRLVARRVLAATEDEIRISEGLPLYDQLADPRWLDAVESAAGQGAIPRLSPRQLLAAVQAASLRPIPADEHPCLDSLDRRRRFYRWLVSHLRAIAEDDPSRGMLGRAAVILSTGGVLRAPRAMLLDDELPDLGVDWNAHAEVPAPLVAWLQATYLPSSRQLQPLVEHLLRGMDDAIAASDAPRLAELLDYLARGLRADVPAELSARVRRFKLRRRLRVEAETGDFERPRRLLAPDARDLDLIERFASVSPPRVAPRYAQRFHALALIRAAGASAELSRGALEALLDGEGLRPGADARVALACYVARAASRHPELLRALRLTERAWIPDRDGAPRKAAELYWPDDDAAAIVGDDRRRFPHPELVNRVPALREALGFRDVESAALDDVVAHITSLVRAEHAVPEAILRWLDDGLAARRLRAVDVRAALGEIAFLRDDAGRARKPGEVVREGARAYFGDRRGDWSDGLATPRLADALRIGRRPGKREVVAYFDELADEIARGADLIESAPVLASKLPLCLDLLVEHGGRGPSRLPLLCRHAGGAERVISIPGPDEIAPPDGEGGDTGAWTPVLADGADAAAWRAYLRGYGVGTAGDAFEDEIGERAGDAAGSRQSAKAPSGARATRVDRPPDDDSGHESSPAREAIDPRAQDDERDSGGLLLRIRRWFRAEQEGDRPPARAPASEAPTPRERPRGDPGPTRDPEPVSTALPRGGERRRRDRRPAPGAYRGASEPRHPDDEPARDEGGGPDPRDWFRGDRQLGSQLRAAAGWLADRRRAAEFGLAHAPRSLPLPYLYAPLAIFAEFDRRGQSWRRVAREEPSWRRGDRRAGRVVLRGRIPAGEAVLPLPLFARVAHASGQPAARILETPTGGAVALGDVDTVITLELELGLAPDFGAAPPAHHAPAALLRPTVADDELPDEVHDKVAELGLGGYTGFERATAIRGFIRERYAYDPSYLEDPAIAAWLRQRARGRSNHHIAALHAGADADHLGRGVCYELNILACEMLRRSGVPAAVATGWTLDRGFLDEPDHLWAMALLDPGDGPRWLPVDASTTRSGRPLHAGRRPPGPWRADANKLPAVRPPDWAERKPRRGAGAPKLPMYDLLRVVRYLEAETGKTLGTRDEVLRACREFLRDPARASKLVELIRRASGADDRA